MQRTEDLVLGKAHRAGGLGLVHAGAASRRIDRLRAGVIRELKQEDRESRLHRMTLTIRHRAPPEGEMHVF